MELKIIELKKNNDIISLKIDQNSMLTAQAIPDNSLLQKDLLVKISDWYKSHTDAQRALFHKWLSVYFLSGFPSDQTKEALKKRLKKQANGVCYVRYESLSFVECLPKDSEYVVLKSTTKYNSKEYNAVIDELISDMVKTGAGEILDKLHLEYQQIKKDFKKA